MNVFPDDKFWTGQKKVIEPYYKEMLQIPVIYGAHVLQQLALQA